MAAASLRSRVDAIAYLRHGQQNTSECAQPHDRQSGEREGAALSQ